MKRRTLKKRAGRYRHALRQTHVAACGNAGFCSFVVMLDDLGFHIPAGFARGPIGRKRGLALPMTGPAFAVFPPRGEP